MTLTPEQAAGMAQMMFADLADEAQTTRKVLAAVPDANPDYRPDEKSRTGFDLAKHIATTEIWFLDGIAKGEFDYAAEEKLGSTLAKPSQVASYYETEFGPALDRVKALNPEQLAKNIEFYGFNMSAVIYLSFLQKHSIHHRGQLSAYLRAMGGKVPSIYGGSADEPWQAAAGAQ